MHKRGTSRSKKEAGTFLFRFLGLVPPQRKIDVADNTKRVFFKYYNISINEQLEITSYLTELPGEPEHNNNETKITVRATAAVGRTRSTDTFYLRVGIILLPCLPSPSCVRQSCPTPRDDVSGNTQTRISRKNKPHHSPTEQGFAHLGLLQAKSTKALQSFEKPDHVLLFSSNNITGRIRSFTNP